MCDSVLSLNPQRAFFALGEDIEWRKSTLESFIRSTSTDLVEDEDPFLLLTPEKLSLRRLLAGRTEAKSKWYDNGMAPLIIALR